MVYVDFESILGPEDSGKQNLDEPYSNKYQKYVAGSYDYKLVCVNVKFSYLFKPHISEDAVHNFLISMLEESKLCSDVTRKEKKSFRVL